MNLSKADNFFRILEKFTQMDRINSRGRIAGISIPIFKTKQGTYNIYFGINPDITVPNEENLNNEETFLQGKHKHIIKEGTGVCLENVSEMELNYILFAFNMKYNVTEGPFSNLTTKRVIRFSSNGVLFPAINIYFHKDSIRYDFLVQHYEGIKRNYFKYQEWQNKNQVKLQLLDNYKVSYEKYIKMLKFYINSLTLNPILTAYSKSYEEFIDTVAEQVVENILNQKDEKEKQFVFVPADIFLKDN